MKIGLFTDTYCPQINGVASSVLMLKENLEMLGHQVYVFTTTDPKAVKDERNVYRVPSLPFVSAIRVGMFYNPRLAKSIEELELDLIHTHTEFSLGIFGRAMAKELNIPLLHTYHTIYEYYTHYVTQLKVLNLFAKIVARKVSANFCNSADKLIVPTCKVRDLLLSYEVRKDISIIPTGIDLHKFSKYKWDFEQVDKLRETLEIGTKDKVMLYIGRIAEEKNIGEIMLALQSYLTDKKDVKFLLIGDGPTKNDLENMAKELGIQEHTIFAGARPWDKIGIYYQLGDVFVGASQSESQGLTYIESLASGVPVVAKADRCLDGVVQNDVNGYVFYDKEEFLRALDCILYDDEQRERLSFGAVESTAKFSIEHFAYTVEALYKNVLVSYKGYQSPN